MRNEEELGRLALASQKAIGAFDGLAFVGRVAKDCIATLKEVLEELDRKDRLGEKCG